MIKTTLKKFLVFFNEKPTRKYFFIIFFFILHVLIPFFYITFLLDMFKDSPEFSIIAFERLGKLYCTRSVTCSFLFFALPTFLLLLLHLLEVIFKKLKSFINLKRKQ